MALRQQDSTMSPLRNLLLGLDSGEELLLSLLAVVTAFSLMVQEDILELLGYFHIGQIQTV